MMQDVRSDLKQGVRQLIRSPGTSAVAILALALGIGLTVTMFSIVYGVMYRGLPFTGADRLVSLSQRNVQGASVYAPLTVHDFHEYRTHQRWLEGVAAFAGNSVALSGTERADRVEGVSITANAFELLGVRPVMGRSFTAADDTHASEPVAIIGYTMWRERFGADPGIIGRSVRVDGRPTTVIGVMPDGFRFPGDQQIWLPLDLDPLSIPRGDGPGLEVFGKLRPGTSRTEAAADLEAIALRMERESPQTNQGVRPWLQPLLAAFLGEQPPPLLLTMMGAVVFVLLIACTNVASLSLGRAIRRSGEVSLRAALGASRARIARQFLTEALVLSIAGCLLGTLIAYAGIQLFNNAMPASRTPFYIDIRIDAIALTVVLALALFTTLMAGALPAMQAARADVMGVIKDEAGSSSFRLGRISRTLVAFEIALSCGLLVAAGLTTRSIAKLRSVDLGFDRSNLFTGVIALPATTYPDSMIPAFHQRVAERLAVIPGFTASTLAGGLPGLGSMTFGLTIEGRPEQPPHEQPHVMRPSVGSSYLSTFGIALLEGRDLQPTDRAGAPPVALVNRAFVDRYLPGEDAVGRRIRLRPLYETVSVEPEWLTIVGVTANARLGELAGNNEVEAVLVPLAQHPARVVHVVGRTRAAPLAMSAPVQDAIAELDRDLPLFMIDTLDGRIAEDTWFFRVFGGLFLLFGAAALVLATIGLYGVMAFSVKQRSRELAIRMAIGADQRSLLRMVLRQGLAQITGGMLVGLVLAAALSQLLAIILFDVNARDPVVFGSVVLVLIATSLAACIIPALHATRADPLMALRRN